MKRMVIIYLMLLMSLQTAFAMDFSAILTALASYTPSYEQVVNAARAAAQASAQLATKAVTEKPVETVLGGLGALGTGVIVANGVANRTVENAKLEREDEKLAERKKQVQVKANLITCLRSNPSGSVSERRKKCPQQVTDFIVYLSQAELKPFIETVLEDEN